MARILKEEKKCDIVICLSHIGFNYKNDPEKVCDVNLARKTKNIDIIIGGHTHTFLDKPAIEKNLDGMEVLINQVGCYGINLGRIDFYLDETKNVKSTGRSIII
jgi:5'-nucleotidase